MATIVYIQDFDGVQPEYKGKLAGDIQDVPVHIAKALIMRGVATEHLEVKEEKTTFKTKEHKATPKTK